MLKLLKTQETNHKIVDIETLNIGDCFRYFKPNTDFDDAIKNDGIFMIGKDGLESKDKITVVQLSGDFAVTKKPKGLLVIKVDVEVHVSEIK